MTRYAVFRLGLEQDRRERLGWLEIDERNKLGLISAEPGAGAMLDRAVADINGRKALVVRRPPGPGQSRFAINKEPVQRNDPAFFAAIQDNLQRWHSMELVAEEP